MGIYATTSFDTAENRIPWDFVRMHVAQLVDLIRLYVGNTERIRVCVERNCEWSSLWRSPWPRARLS